MTKREFMIQYVLNRAAVLGDRMSGRDEATAATFAWVVIEREAPLPTLDPPMVRKP